MGGTATLSAVRDTTHVMEVRLERAAGGYRLTQVSRYAAPDQLRQEQETPRPDAGNPLDGRPGGPPPVTALESMAVTDG